MKIEHVAIWVKDLELMKDFYLKYFNMETGKKYSNSKKKFSSYFLAFGSDTTRIELMHNSTMAEISEQVSVFGLAHIAISVGNKNKVDQVTNILQSDGYTIKSKPRTTGDGYYESIILDPEGNEIEITV